MTYIVKRKFQGALGDDTNNSDMANLLQHIQSNPPLSVVSQDTLILNHLIVKKTLKIPVGTDKYR